MFRKAVLPGLIAVLLLGLLLPLTTLAQVAAAGMRKVAFEISDGPVDLNFRVRRAD